MQTNLNCNYHQQSFGKFFISPEAKPEIMRRLKLGELDEFNRIFEDQLTNTVTNINVDKLKSGSNRLIASIVDKDHVYYPDNYTESFISSLGSPMKFLKDLANRASKRALDIVEEAEKRNLFDKI